jgi:hypothetical protein
MVLHLSEAAFGAKRKNRAHARFPKRRTYVGYAAGRSSAALLAATDLPGSGTANKMAINPTNATSDHKLSTKKFSSYESDARTIGRIL